MSKFVLINGLPYLTVSITHNQRTISIQNVVLDTGSATSIFKSDDLLSIGVKPESTDEIEQMRGIRNVERLWCPRRFPP